jgi:hypothetical protein
MAREDSGRNSRHEVRTQMSLQDELQLARDACLEWKQCACRLEHENRRLRADNAELQEAVAYFRKREETAEGQNVQRSTSHTAR